MSVREQFVNNSSNNKNTYENALELVRSKITDNHRDLLAENDADEIKKQLVKTIKQILIKEKIFVDGCQIDELTNRIYDDMAGGSFLTKYIYNTPNVEEVNINRWDDVTVTYSGKKPEKIKEQFSSPQQAIDIVKRLIQPQKLTLDNTTPSCLSYLSDGVRICANIAPVVSKDAAVSASIRIVRTEDVKMDTLLEFGSATQEMLEFLKLCVKDYVSVCISGSVGAGKTTTLAAMLSCAKDDDRVITIEEGSREFSLLRRDENGHIINNVLSKLTRYSDNPDLVIDQEDLLEHCLRENPDIMGIGEMRSAEAYTVAEAARTGTATYTTTHAKNAFNTYDRLTELSYKKYAMNQDYLMKQMIEAFPIIVFQKKFPDGSRRIVEIIEGEYFDRQKKEVVGRTLYKYVVENNIENEKGEVVKVVGRFEKVDDISDSLYDTFISNGATTKTMNRFLKNKKGV